MSQLPYFVDTIHIILEAACANLGHEVFIDKATQLQKLEIPPYLERQVESLDCNCIQQHDQL